MRNTTLAAFISSALLAAASTQAQPAPNDPSSSTDAQQQTTNTTTTSTTTPASATDSMAATTDKNATSTPNSSNASDAAWTAESRWKAADTDSSGTLSVSEMQASMPSVAENFQQMDSNSDGQVSKDELHNYKSQHGKADLFIHDGCDESGDHQIAGRVHPNRQRSRPQTLSPSRVAGVLTG